MRHGASHSGKVVICRIRAESERAGLITGMIAAGEDAGAGSGFGRDEEASVYHTSIMFQYFTTVGCVVALSLTNRD